MVKQAGCSHVKCSLLGAGVVGPGSQPTPLARDPDPAAGQSVVLGRYPVNYGGGAAQQHTLDQLHTQGMV